MEALSDDVATSHEVEAASSPKRSLVAYPYSTD